VLFTVPAVAIQLPANTILTSGTLSTAGSFDQPCRLPVSLVELRNAEHVSLCTTFTNSDPYIMVSEKVCPSTRRG
jgi:hypothetical protein